MRYLLRKYNVWYTVIHPLAYCIWSTWFYDGNSLQAVAYVDVQIKSELSPVTLSERSFSKNESFRRTRRHHPCCPSSSHHWWQERRWRSVPPSGKINLLDRDLHWKRFHWNDQLDLTSVVVPSSTATRSCAPPTASSPPTTSLPVLVPFPSLPRDRLSALALSLLTHSTTPAWSTTITWSSPPREPGTTTSTSPQFRSSTHQPLSCQTAPHARLPATATPSTSPVSQVSSPPPSSGPTSTASPSPSARRSGALRLWPPANSVLPLMVSPPAWVTLVDHSPPTRAVSRNFWVMSHGDTPNAQSTATHQPTPATLTQLWTSGSRRTPTCPTRHFLFVFSWNK